MGSSKFICHERSTKKDKKEEADEDELPPSKKMALATLTGQEALNKCEVDGMSLVQTFLQDEQFRSLELPKLLEEEKTRVSNEYVNLAIRTTDEQKVQLVTWNRFRSLYLSGKIHIRSSRTNPVTMVTFIIILYISTNIH